MKMNYIVTGSFSFPTAIVPQLTIFSKQLDKLINVSLVVAVLSSFPIFLHDYYGNEGLKIRIG